MSIAVRPANLKTDQDELVRFCHDNIADRPDERRFHWLYQDNPFGPAMAWIATDTASGKTAGVAAAFPRRFWIGGNEERAWILGDFCISRELRSLGPALTLQRTCMAALPENELWYDFPSTVMEAIYRRLGVPTFGQEVRYVKLLKLDVDPRKIVRSSAGKALSVYGSWNLWRQSQAGLECAMHSGDFGEEFTSLDRQASAQYLFQGRRTAEYLNWRYRRIPRGRYQVITARKTGELQGYAVLRLDGREATLIDLMAIDAESATPNLLAYSDQILRETNVERLNLTILGESALERQFRQAGFIPRERHPVMVYRQSEAEGAAVYQPKNWLLLQGDREG